MLEQKTIQTPVKLSGVGLHSGKTVSLELHPREPDTGVVFVRTDLPDRPRVEARPENLVSRPRRTALASGGAEVHTTEHLLAALFGAGIQNLEVRLDGLEVPGLDGSALPFYEAIRNAGAKRQGKPVREVRLRQPIAVTDGGASLIAVTREEGLSIGYTLDYSSAWRGDLTACPSTQFLELEITEDSFAREIAPARTFVLEKEIQNLQAAGLGKGANTQNTLVLGKDGIIGNELRFRDEFVRHKILDLLGDLYLMGCRLHGHVLGTRSGHALNVRLAKLILDDWTQAGAATRNPTSSSSASPPASPGSLPHLSALPWGVEQIQEFLPHRYPFLLVDRIVQVDGDRRIVGLKNVTFSEHFFQGHFPGQPVMPGVLVVEAMAQLAGVLLLKKTENSGRIAFLLSLDKVKFRKSVTPGDQLLLEATLTRVRSRAAEVEARASVDGSLVAEAEIRYMIVDV
jgi:UDP-3-O-[3-hydroxymyristoyl] N-acetylglucosamine deacetylase/3-hydroxyacyl-[acyl-carrier-protein] dehydratase